MATLERDRVLTYEERYDALRETKLAQTLEKQRVVGSMDHDDWGMILPPEDRREIVETISTSGMPITDVLIKGFAITPNHPSGGFFGPKAVGENFRALMEAHPVYVDPMGSLAGAYMVNYSSYIQVRKPPELDLGDLPEEEDYQTLGGFVVAQWGRIPAVADEFTWRRLRIEVVDMDGNRVDKVLVTVSPEQEPDFE